MYQPENARSFVYAHVVTSKEMPKKALFEGETNSSIKQRKCRGEKEEETFCVFLVSNVRFSKTQSAASWLPVAIDLL